jgi:prepilin-type N-terminal cleavage/methylation domain-containing protein
MLAHVGERRDKMKTCGHKSGFTLIEMLLVVAVIVILVGMVVGVAKRIEDQGKERLTRDTLALIGNALEQFRDFGYEYKSTYYDGLTFPLDCNGFDILTGTFPYPNLPDTLRDAIYPPGVNITGGVYDPNFSGSAAMYFILSQVPDCRKTLDKIDKSLLTNKGLGGTPITITIGTSPALPFTRIIDPWKTPLRYDYYPDFADYTGTIYPYKDYRDSAKRTFPLITSAGPDKTFDTFDDISNNQQK